MVAVLKHVQTFCGRSIRELDVPPTPEATSGEDLAAPVQADDSRDSAIFEIVLEGWRK